VVSIVVSIGLSILDLSTKQIRLSTNAKDSEIAFHAANAGVECARFWRNSESSAMEQGQSINPSCFGSSASNNDLTSVPSSGLEGDGDVYKYEYDFTWGTNNDRCTEIITMVALGDALNSAGNALGEGVTTPDMTEHHIAGYPIDESGQDDWYCGAAERCTLISVRGYNRSCINPDYEYSAGTVEREVLLQF
jgi:Tfp pilus assembly protein PilX